MDERAPDIADSKLRQFPVRTIYYNSFFLLRTDVVLNGQPAEIGCSEDRELTLSCKSLPVSEEHAAAKASISYPSISAKVEDTLKQHGVFEVTCFYCADAPLFQVNFTSEYGLKQFLKNKKKVEKELADVFSETPRTSQQQEAQDVRIEACVNATLFLTKPDPIATTQCARPTLTEVTLDNHSTCMAVWQKSAVFGFEDVFRKFRQDPTNLPDKVVSLSHLNELLNLLAAIAGKWELFLTALGLSKREIDQIKVERAQLPDSPKLCLLDGLNRWFHSTNCPTYGNIIQALNTNLVNDKPLAAFIETFADIKSKFEALQPTHGTLPEPSSKQTASGTTPCEPTSPSHQTSTAPALPSGRPTSPPLQPTNSSDDSFDKTQATSQRNKLQGHFTDQVVKLKNFLKRKHSEKNLMSPGFLDGFILKLSDSVKDEHENFLESKSTTITKATTFEELFLCLNVYWNYLNYTLLEGIIEAHGTDEMVKDMERYVKDLQNFRRKTTLNVYWQVERHKIRSMKPPPDFCVFVTKHSITAESTLEDIENVRLEITKEFHLSKCALLLADVVKGSVLIAWFVPFSAISRLKHGLGQSQLLEELHIDSAQFFDEFEDTNVGKESLQTAFFRAAASGDSAKVVGIVHLGVDVNARDEYGWTALMWAASGGHTDTLEALEALGADVNTQANDGLTALMLAAGKKHTDTIRSLAALGAIINIKNNDGVTAMMFAAVGAHTDTLQALAALGADVNIQNKDGLTALMFTAMNSHIDAMQTLATLGADVNIQNNEGLTALMIATNKRDTNAIQALAKLGADLNIQNKDGWTALIFAVVTDLTDSILVLVALGADMNVQTKDGLTALMLAAGKRGTNTVHALAAFGANMNLRNNNGQTALMSAAASGHPEIVRTLAGLGADKNIQNKDGLTALMLAAVNGHTDSLQALAELGAGVNVQNESGWTALMYAALSGHTGTMQALAALGANVNIQNGDGLTAVMFAVVGCHIDTIRALASLGADVNIQNKIGLTAFMLAATKGQTDIMQVLAGLGANIDIPIKGGGTILMWAAVNGDVSTIQKLATLGSNIHIQDDNGRTALMYAAVMGHTDSVKALVTLGADIHTLDNDENTALIHAFGDSSELHTETVEVLIAAGSKLNLPEKATGWTALFFAAKWGSLPILKLVLERGADPTIRDKEGSTASDVASVYGHEGVMEELAKHIPPLAEASPPLPETTVATSATQPTDTAQSSITKRERVYRAVRMLAEKMEQMALPGRVKKREALAEQERVILPSQQVV